MPTMKNPRSLFLQSANPRLLTSPNADVLLSASTPIFHVNNSGVSTPPIITLNASLIAMEGTVVFSCEGGTLSNIVGNTCTLNYETLTGDNAKVVATITYRNKTYTDTVEISKVYDGQNGVVGMNNAVVYAYQRSATQPTGTPGAVQYSFSAAAIVTTTLANGWLKTIPAGTSPLWITAASASASGTTDDIAANEWSSAVVLAQDGAQGANGINSATVTIYKRQATTTPPALPSASTTYTFTPAGLAGLDNGWTTTLPPTANGKYLFASTATAASTAATDSIAANEWATAQMLVQDGTAGTRGNVQVARAIPGSVWSDSEAALAISGAGYGVPQSRDIVTLHNNSTSYSEPKYYDGAAWQALAAYFPASVIVDGTLDATKLKAQTITGDKIKAGAITANSLAVSGNGDNLITDPQFKDLTWWGRVGTPVVDYSSSSSTWTGGSALTIDTSVGATQDTITKTFSMTPGATYRVEFQAFVDPTFVGNVSAYWYIPGYAWHLMGGPNRGYNWGDGLPVAFDGNSTKGMQTFAATVTLAADSQVSRGLLRIKSQCTAGYMRLGSFSITRVSDSVLIADGAVTADKVLAGSIGTNQLSISQGGAINSGQTGFDTGNGFWIEGVGNGHGARMSLGTAGGPRMIADPNNNRFEMVGPTISNPTVTTTFSVSAPSPRVTNQANGTMTLGVTPTVSNGSGNYAYTWTFSTNGPQTSMDMVSSPAASAMSISASGSNTWVYGFYSLTVRDLNTSATASASGKITVQFGSGAEP